MVRAGGLRSVVILLIGLSVLLATGCSSSSGPLTAEELEKKAQGIDKSLMCPICPSETIDQSQVALAKQMQVIVREKLAQGESREEILQFFVDKYGKSVLAEPPKSGFTLLVWVFPPLILAIGGGLLVLVVRGMRRPPQESAVAEDIPAGPEMDPYLTAVDQEIQRLGLGGGRGEGNPPQKPDEGASSEEREG